MHKACGEPWKNKKPRRHIAWDPGFNQMISKFTITVFFAIILFLCYLLMTFFSVAVVPSV